MRNTAALHREHDERPQRRVVEHQAPALAEVAQQGRSRRGTVRGPRRRPPAQGQCEHEERHDEREHVEHQPDTLPHGDDDDPRCDDADHLVDLVERAQQPGADQALPRVGQHVGHHGAVRGLERRGERLGHE